MSYPKSRGRVAVVIVAAAALALASSAYLYLSRGQTGAKSSIAVLPFQNAGGDPDMEYLSDGISESLINSLSRLPGVRVLARGTTFRFKGKDVDPQDIGKQLNVDAILTGRVVRAGDSLTVQADLVSVADGSQLWGERYSRKAADVLAVQEDIAREIVGRLRPTLSREEQGRVGKRYTENAEAYQLYLQGRYHWNKRSPEGFKRAINYFRQAAARDPSYALAYAGLADSYSLQPIFDISLTATQTMPLAKEAAQKALSLDEELAEAHAALGLIHDIYDYEYGRAEVEYRRAIELNPNYASAHQWYGRMLTALGRFDEGLAEHRRALELDPLSLIINMTYGMSLNFARRYDEAIAQLRKTLELDPNFADANSFLFEAYANKGMHAEAVDAYAKQMAIDGEPPAEVAAAKAAFAKSGWQGFMRHVTERVEARVRQGERVFPADLYARMGERDKAFAWLEKSYEARNDRLTFLKVDPRYDPIRSDPRFADLLRRVGHSQ